MLIYLAVEDSEPLDGEELGGDSKEFTHIGKIRQNQADYKRVELENDKDDKMDRECDYSCIGR